VIAALGQFDADEARVLEQLKRDTPALRVRDQGKYERLERAIAGALAERAGASPRRPARPARRDARHRVLRVGGGGWVDAVAAGVPTRDYVRQIVGALGAGLTRDRGRQERNAERGGSRHTLKPQQC
jgi:hypothetical protein